MSGCFSIGFIDFMLKGKNLLEYTNLFSPNEYKNNIKIFSIESKYFKIIVMFAINIENVKKLKYHILKKTLSLSIVYSTCGHEYEKIFKEEESIEILKTLGVINNIEEHNINMSGENISQEFRLKK